MAASVRSATWLNSDGYWWPLDSKIPFKRSAEVHWHSTYVYLSIPLLQPRSPGWKAITQEVLCLHWIPSLKIKTANLLNHFTSWLVCSLILYINYFININFFCVDGVLRKSSAEIKMPYIPAHPISAQDAEQFLRFDSYNCIISLLYGITSTLRVEPILFHE